MSPDDSTVPSVQESTVLDSGVEIIASGIRIQINNAKHIPQQRQKYKFINVKIKMLSELAFPLFPH